MLGPVKLRALDDPVTISLESLVPANQFYRHLDAQLDLTFVREWVQELYKAGGRPSIDPIVFFKLQLIMFFEGIRSERRLIETANLNLAHRWYLGYSLDEPLPDHSSLTRIRQRLGLATFERFFEQVVALCQRAGLVWGEELLFDATKIRANADVDTLVPRFYWRAKQHLDDLFADGTAVAPAGNAEQPAPEGEARAATLPRTLPVPLTAAESEALAAENVARWPVLDHRRLDPDRPPSGPYQRATDRRVSTTDPDAALMHIGGHATLGYHDHYVVDGGKQRIILHAVVTPADVMENTPMLDLVRRVRFRWKLRPKRAVGDTAYGTGENLQGLAADGIRAYVPLPDWGKNSPFFSQRDFAYDPAQDVYRCPRGTVLRLRGNNYVTGVRIYQAPTESCQACPIRSQCTDSREGRKLNRPFDEEYRERVREDHRTEAHAKAMRKRAVWVEPLFGEAKQWHGLRQFRLRGLENVNMQALLVAAGQNLKRWLVARGWGRRHGPQGSLLAIPIPPASRSGLGIGATPAR